ncbi:MAG: right-handed parallel beta-helix repeat-containing protein, partial [Thermoplasmata archaeon]|nr:right-handed parallel beta-helix repeat-containing protein [Thermoplasmata archaeon]
MSSKLGILLFFLAIVVVWTIAFEDANAQTPPPTSGDWVISDDTHIEDTRVYLKGNITVTASGNLTLVNVTVRMNQTSPGQYNILIESGGRFSLLDRDGVFSVADSSRIHSQNWRNGFAITCEPGSHLRVIGSIISTCGIGMTEALTIRTDDALIMNSTYSEGGLGIFIDGCAPVIINTTFWDCREYGIRVRNGSPLIESCTIKYTGDVGILIESSTKVDIRNCTFSRHKVASIIALNGTVRVKNTSVSDSDGDGIVFDGAAEGLIERCDVFDIEGNGIHLIGNGTFTISHNFIRVIRGNGIIVSESKSDIKIGWNHLDRCLNDSVILQRSWAIMNDNVIENSNRSGVVLSESSWVSMNGDVIRDNANDGIDMRSGRYISAGVLENIKVNRNGGTGIYLHDRSMLTLYNSSFRNNGWYAIYCDGGSQVTWHVRSNSSVVNEAMRIRGQVDVTDGAVLSLVNTTYEFVHDYNIQASISAIGSTIRVLDGDGDPRTMQDASELFMDHPSQYAFLGGSFGTTVTIRNSVLRGIPVKVTDGIIDLEGCDISETYTPIVAESMAVTLRLVDCSFADCNESVYALSSKVEIRECTFVRVDRFAVVLGGCNDARISNCTFIGCGEGVRLTSGRNISITDSRFHYSQEPFIAEYIQGLDLVNVKVVQSGSHGMRILGGSTNLTGCSISDSRKGGMVVDDGHLMVVGCTISYNIRAGIIANYTTLYMDRTSITETNGFGIWIVDNSGLSSATRLIMRDCFFDGATGYEVRLEESTQGEAFNTNLAPEDCRVLDRSSFVLWYEMTVVVMMIGNEPVPPFPIQYTVEDSEGTRIAEGSMTVENTLLPFPVKAYNIEADKTTVYAPYAVNATVAGRTWHRSVEMEYLKYARVEVWPDIQPSLDMDENVIEGIETVLSGSSSIAYPFNIAEWHWDIDPGEDPGTDATGPLVKWTFPHDGPFEVLLTIIDTVGNRNEMEFTILVQDAGPRAIFDMELPDQLDEDEVLRLEGRYETVVDRVLLQEWNFGDGSKDQGAIVNHSWARSGVYNVTYTVVEVDASLDQLTFQIMVVNVAPISLLPARSIVAGKMDLVLLDATGSYDTPSDRSSLKYLWTLKDAQMLIGVKGYYTFERAGVYVLNLTIIDNDGASDTSNMTVTIINQAPRFGQMPDVRLNNTDPGVQIELRRFVADPDDHESEWKFNVSVDEERIVAVDILYDPGIGWYLRIHPFEGAEGAVEVILKVDDGDGGTNFVTFIVTVVDHTTAEETDT